MKSFYFTAVADSFFTSIASFFVLLVVSSYFIPYPITLIFSGSFAIIFGDWDTTENPKDRNRNKNVFANRALTPKSHKGYYFL